MVMMTMIFTCTITLRIHLRTLWDQKSVFHLHLLSEPNEIRWIKTIPYVSFVVAIVVVINTFNHILFIFLISSIYFLSLQILFAKSCSSPETNLKPRSNEINVNRDDDASGNRNELLTYDSAAFDAIACVVIWSGHWW